MTNSTWPMSPSVQPNHQRGDPGERERDDPLKLGESRASMTENNAKCKRGLVRIMVDTLFLFVQELSI